MNMPMHIIQPDQDPTSYATDAQRRASDPTRSVWVNASAGTGKTKVLIERVLRLLLPRADGTPGSAPHRILCLTYTKAAAQEMTERLIAKVADWAVCAEDKLVTQLTDMMGVLPNVGQIHAARRLFTRLIDGPEQVRLMTIHAFCASILARFPLEAGIAPHFTQIEGAAVEEALRQARQDVIQSGQNDPELSAYLQRIHTELSDDRFAALLDAMFSERRQLQWSLIKTPVSERDIALRSIFALGPNDDLRTWAARVENPPAWVIDDFQKIVMGLSTGTSTEKKYADFIRAWLSVNPEQRAEFFENTLRRGFFGEAGNRYTDGTHQGARKKDPDLAAAYVRAGDFVAEQQSFRVRLDLHEANLALLSVAERILHAYDVIKSSRGQLDFDDLIRATARLLGADQNRAGPSTTPSWVMYKLEGGIDHVLVDEAQDTNPEQWRIISALTEGIATPDPERARTLFVVGDQKQSIYRFQGADPDAFDAMRSRMDQNRVVDTHKIDRIPLNTSFRSGAAVLTLVDHVFQDPEQYQALRLDAPTTHVIRRRGQGSCIEIWPCLEAQEKERTYKAWTPPTTIQPLHDVTADLAQKIARKVQSWITQKTILPSYDRPIEPRDILILVRKRAPLMPLLRAALKSAGIPVAGSNRQVLTEQLVVKDVLAMMRLTLLPHDDLNLACVLKGPFINLDDDDLIHLGAARTGSLWNALQNDKNYATVASYLDLLLNDARQMGPYNLVTHILYRPCPALPDGTGMMAIRQFMGDDHIAAIDDILNIMMDAEQDGQMTQSIMNELEKTPPEVKHDTLPGDNVVRIMTVHGSKGLEAPIVILPDTVGGMRTRRDPPIFWPDETDHVLPIWSPRKAERSDDLMDVDTQGQLADRAEDRRLLYVALTRAQDWLIVAGAQKEKKRDPQCWYDVISAGMDRLKTFPGYDESGGKKTFETPQTAIPDGRAREERLGLRDVPSNNLNSAVPKILQIPLVDDPQPARPYRATAASRHALPVSPLVTQQDPNRFMRGLMTHKLLQVLPNLPPDQRRTAMAEFLITRANQVPQEMADLIAREVDQILNHPEFAPLFTQAALAEVPITGMTADGRLIAGQIDRLLITDTEILVIDYKTNRPPPVDAAQIPAAYIEQMRAYRDVLVGIYPGRTIRCALLWTDGPRLMDVPLPP